ncbi:MAG: glycosyltransferase family 1 protein [Magnetococcales bacterium]|nr:glycosyltransferase family 1 protein [Magnetococcales bacterium]
MKIAVFLPKEDFFHRFLGQSLKNAFTRVGAAVIDAPLRLENAQVEALARERRPDLIFDMNRTRNVLPGLPGETIHAAWMVDFDAKREEEISGSELLYFLEAGWIPYFTQLRDRGGIVGERIDWLPAAACPETFYPAPADKSLDFSFVGHLSAPWSEAELGRPVLVEGGRRATFGEVLPPLERRSLDLANGRVAAPELTDPGYQIHMLRGVLREMGFTGEPDLSDPALRYDVYTRVHRMAVRMEPLRLALGVSRNAAFYGTGGWEAWPEFRPYFHGWLEDQARAAELFRATRLNLHNGVANHFRVFFCMAAGGVVLHHRQRLDAGAEQLARLGIESGVHYLSATSDDFAEQARHYLAHPEELEAMGRRAAEWVHGHHLWDHRARRVMADAAAFRGGG